MNADEYTLPDGVSPLRFMIADSSGTHYRHCKTLAEARSSDGAVAIMEGDYGGQIYFTCPACHIKCDADVLTELLNDLDSLKWNDPDGAGLYFEIVSIGSAIAGGMGGGEVVDGVWLHPDLECRRTEVEAVITGSRPTIDRQRLENA